MFENIIRQTSNGVKKELYKLPDLPYGYDALEPYISEETLKLHHDKHHLAYVTAANALMQKLWEGREKNLDIDYKAILKSLSFNVAGHILHDIFWKTMTPADSGKNQPSGKISKAIEEEFGSLERFKKEFSGVALSVEGSGWAVLTHSKESGRLLIAQIEKHNMNYYPMHKVLLPLDVWEHAYYVDYKNDRAKFIENWWNIVNWEEVDNRFAG